MPENSPDNDQEPTHRFADLALALRFALSQLRGSSAPAMAANLAFRTLFGMLPVLVVATILTRAVLGEGFLELVHRVIEAVGLNKVTVIPADGSDAAGVPIAPWIESLAQQAAEIDLSAIGLVGALAVVFSAVWTMVAIESSFNAVYRAPTGRSFVRRMLIYWFVLTMGPVLFAAIPLGLRALADVLGEDSTIALVFARAVSSLGGFVSIWVLLSAAYAAVPNTRVDVRAAAAGAFVATVLIEIGKQFLGATLAGSFAASRLYGSLGVLPLFMMWVYLMWLVVLFGLQVSAILQGLRGGARRLAAGSAPECFEPAQAIACFRAICTGFRRGRGTTVDGVVRQCGLAPASARGLLRIFEERGLAHRIEGGAGRFAPSRPPEEVSIAEVLRAGFAFADGGVEIRVDDEIAALREAQIAKLGEQRFSA
ncbi:MAG: YihY/virulence factor BrkB family protein [Phycisphaerales bacterium]|jgi:membrane protein